MATSQKTIWAGMLFLRTIFSSSVTLLGFEEDTSSGVLSMECAMQSGGMALLRRWRLG